MSTGFPFGAKTTATPAFGTGSITFGTPATQPAQFGFGNLSSSAPSLFGTPTTTSALGFKPTGFGAPTPTAGFGLTSAPTFGTTAPSFGTPVSSAQTGFAFGKIPASTELSFAPASTGLSFPASIAKTSTFGTPTTGAAPSFSFAPNYVSSFSYTPGQGQTIPPGLLANVPFFDGLGNRPPAITAPTGLRAFSRPVTVGSEPPTWVNLGLGGIATSKTGTSINAQKDPPPKEHVLPNEFLQLVEHFKTVVQEEKNRSSDVARCSVKEFRKVENELDSLNHQFNHLENQLTNNRNLAEQLKYDTAKGLQNIEMAQRTQDTPPNLQYDNTAPLQFFLSLADNFEHEMQLLKMKIDNTEKFVKKCGEPNILTSQDLALGLKRLHETFVALAGRMQSIHSQVEAQKEVFLSFRRQAVKDNINPFEKLDKHVEAMNFIMKNAIKEVPPNLAPGPTPFNSIALGSIAAQQTQPPPYPTTTAGFNLGSGELFGTNTSKTTSFTPFQLSNSSNFQLQKPPTGNKRGKQ